MYIYIQILIYLWLHWIFVAVHALSLVAMCRLLLLVASLVEHRLQDMMTSVVEAHGLSCSMACVIFLDQGSNQCPLHWQVDF